MTTDNSRRPSPNHDLFEGENWRENPGFVANLARLWIWLEMAAVVPDNLADDYRQRKLGALRSSIQKNNGRKAVEVFEAFAKASNTASVAPIHQPIPHFYNEAVGELDVAIADGISEPEAQVTACIKSLINDRFLSQPKTRFTTLKAWIAASPQLLAPHSPIVDASKTKLLTTAFSQTYGYISFDSSPIPSRIATVPVKRCYL